MATSSLRGSRASGTPPTGPTALRERSRTARPSRLLFGRQELVARAVPGRPSSPRLSLTTPAAAVYDRAHARSEPPRRRAPRAAGADRRRKRGAARRLDGDLVDRAEVARQESLRADRREDLR